jgi:hypothetical protein
MLVDAPDFATKLGIWTVSNPRSKDRAKDFFEKIHVRPQIEEAKKTLRNPDVSEKDKLIAKDTLYRLRDRRGSANMMGGVATQTICDLTLVMDKEGKTLDMAEATHAGVEQLQAYQPNSELDESKKEKYLEELPLVAEHAVKGLQEAMASDNRILGEVELLKPLPTLSIPYHTKPDYNRRGDLKTKWSRPSSRSKSGWQNASLPNSLTGMFDMNNVFQAAGFWALNGNLPPFIVYANATDYRVFTPENAPELRDDFLQDIINETTLYHRTTENILKASKTKADVFRLVSPDWSAIYWQETETYLDEAKKLWGLI